MYDYYDYGYDYVPRTTNPTPFIVIAIIAAIAVAILSFIFLLPEKKRPTLNKFLRVVSDIFNFKSLLLEKILKFFYIVLTTFFLVFGFFMLFMQTWGRSLAPTGLLIMIISPLVIRILFEASMMFIVLVKNTIDINKKLGNNNATSAPSFDAPKDPSSPVASQNDDAAIESNTKVCPSCGAQSNDVNSAFCTNCGSKF